MMRTWPALPSCLVAACLLMATPAFAQRVEGDRAVAQGTYSAEVPVRNQSDADRNAGFARALSQVLGKLSGDRSAVSRPGVGQELRRARDYVDGYDYRQDEGVSPTGAPTYATTLVVRFDQDKVDGVVAALGLPVWPQPRPKPVIWLAIDDGAGPRLVGLQQSAAAKPLTQRAIDRGFRLGLPAGSAAEQAAVGAIWRGDTGAIARLSARYSPPMQLVGKLYRSKGGWTADWIFVDNARELATWSVTDADARRAMASGADGAADALTKKYARRSASGTPGIQRVTVTGINSSADLIALSAYLQGVPVIRHITPVRATPGALELDLDLLTGMPGLRRMIDSNVLMETDAGAAGTTIATQPDPQAGTEPLLLPPPQPVFMLRRGGQ